VGGGRAFEHAAKKGELFGPCGFRVEGRPFAAAVGVQAGMLGAAACERPDGSAAVQVVVGEGHG
jgi:hypothetical protein